MTASRSGPDAAPGPRALPALARLFPGLYYGWIIAVALCLQSVVVAGIGFYGIPVFLSALSREGGFALAEVSRATTLYMLSGGVFGTAVGRGLDRLGPRRFFLPGALLMAAALVLLGRISQTWQLYAVYLLLSLGSSLCGGAPANAMLARWFMVRRARAMSIAHTGVSIGGALLIPGATALIEERGLPTATAVLAVLLLLVVAPISLFVLRSDPHSFGLAVDGGAAPERGAPAADWTHQRRTWRVREALRTRAFWGLVLGFGGVFFCQVAVTTHMLQILGSRLDPHTAARVAACSPIGSIVARLVLGGFADRMRKGELALGLVLLQSAAYLLFAHAQSAPWLYAGALCFGFAIGNLFMLQPLMVGEVFGITSFGTVSGALALLTQTLQALGPFALALAVSRGGYATGLPLLAGLAAGSAALLTRVRPPGDARAFRSGAR